MNILEMGGEYVKTFLWLPSAMHIEYFAILWFTNCSKCVSIISNGDEIKLKSMQVKYIV